MAKALYNEIITEVGSQEDAKKYNTTLAPPPVTRIETAELWWDQKITTTSNPITAQIDQTEKGEWSP